MSNEQQKQTKTVVATAPETTELDRLITGPVSFVPFGEKSPITFDDNLILRTLVRPTKKGQWPDEQELFKFKQLCKARGLNPYDGDCYLVGYDGANGPQFSIITSIYAFLKRARASDDFDGMTSGIIVKDESGAIVDRVGDFMLEKDVVLGGWATVHQKGIGHPMTKRLNIEGRQKDTPLWKSDWSGMICKCAEVDALRSAYPSQVGGLYIAGEIGEELPVAKARPSGSDSLNAAVAERQAQTAQQDEKPKRARKQTEPETALEPTPEPQFEAAPEPKPAPEPSASTINTWGNFWDQMMEAAQDQKLEEDDAAKGISRWLLKIGMKGKHEKIGVPTLREVHAKALAGQFDWAEGKVLA